MQLTIDSAESLDTVLSAIGGIYGVRLVVASTEMSAAPKAEKSPTVSPIKRRSSAKRKGTAASGKVAAATTRTKTATDGQAAIRTWAKENGLAVASRGRLSADVTEAYQSARRVR